MRLVSDEKRVWWRSIPSRWIRRMFIPVSTTVLMPAAYTGSSDIHTVISNRLVLHLVDGTGEVTHLDRLPFTAHGHHPRLTADRFKLGTGRLLGHAGDLFQVRIADLHLP